MNEKEQQLWAHIREGRSCVAVGLAVPLSLPEDLIVIRLSCAVPWSSGRPMQQAYSRILHWLGEDSMMFPSSESSLRTQLLGEMPVQLQEKGFVAACNRLAVASAGQALLVFDAAEHADNATRHTLQYLCGNQAELKLPWVLLAHEAPTDEVADWFEEMRTIHSDIVSLENETTVHALFPTFDWPQLPARPLQVLRAGAVVGSVFEASLVARLLGCTTLSVIEALQEATDTGAPLGDYGDGRFFLPHHSIERLRKGILPSLLYFWNQRLAALLSATEPSSANSAQGSRKEHLPSRSTIDLSGAMSNTTLEAIPQDQTPRADGDSAQGEEHSQEQPHAIYTTQTQSEESAAAAIAASREWYRTGDDSVEEPRDEDLWFLPSGHTAQGKRASNQSAPEAKAAELPQDHLRAARYLQRVGRNQEALDMHLQGVHRALAAGDLQKGTVLAKEALELVETMPQSPQKSLMESRVMLEMARLQWHGVHLNDHFPLQSALASIQSAKALLPENAPLSLLGQIATVYAGICYDVGDVSSLDQALQDLTEVSRLLLTLNEPLLAAQLLNDQAALYIRLGDPLQASHLLYKARELFSAVLRHNPEHPMAQREQAETEHLLARLPLHAPARPGKELDVIAAAIQHTHHAEALFVSLEDPKQQARVWETRGRLQMELGQFPEAMEQFRQSLWMQRKLGDRMGLARTNAAMAEVHTCSNEFAKALQCLRESILFNLEQGAPIGLAFNRRAVEELVALANKGTSEIPQGLLEAVEQLLISGELYLGHIPLPKDRKEGLLHS